MSWIESHDELPTHPKTRKAARKLGVNVPTTIGHLHVLWYWCLSHRPDGRLEGMDSEDIADAAEWDGDPDVFTDALTSAGWLDDDAGTLVVHDWWDGAGKTIKRRKYATERQRRARESQPDDGQVTDDEPDGNGDDASDSRDSHGDVTRDTHDGHVADRDRDSDKDQDPPPGRNGKPFVSKLADELREEHGFDPEERQTWSKAFHDLLAYALEHLPEERHHSTAMGVIFGYAEKSKVQVTREARNHTARLVATHPPLKVLNAWDQAIQWGAGIDGEHGKDALALSKYAAAVLAGKGDR